MLVAGDFLTPFKSVPVVLTLESVGKCSSVSWCKAVFLCELIIKGVILEIKVSNPKVPAKAHRRESERTRYLSEGPIPSSGAWKFSFHKEEFPFLLRKSCGPAVLLTAAGSLQTRYPRVILSLPKPKDCVCVRADAERKLSLGNSQRPHCPQPHFTGDAKASTWTC